jgi:hypothetical protein
MFTLGQNLATKLGRNDDLRPEREFPRKIRAAMQ